MILLRSTFPRYRYDQLMLLCWTSIFPTEWLYFYVCFMLWYSKDKDYYLWNHRLLTLLLHSLPYCSYRSIVTDNRDSVNRDSLCL